MARFMHADTKKRFESSMELLIDGLKELNERLSSSNYDYTDVPEIAIPYLLEWELAHNRVGWVYFENSGDGLEFEFKPVRAKFMMCMDENDEPIIVVYWAY